MLGYSKINSVLLSMGTCCCIGVVICSFRWRYFKVLWHRKQKRESWYCCTGTREGVSYPLAHICQGCFYLRFICSCTSSSSVMSNHEPVNLFTAQRTEKSTNELVFTSCLLCLLEYENIFSPSVKIYIFTLQASVSSL